MLHWSRKKIHKRIRVWLQLVGWSVVLHTLFLGMILVSYRDQLDEFVFTMHNRQQIDCEVVVMLEPQPQRMQQRMATQAAHQRTKPAAPQTALVQQKKVVPKKPVLQPKKVIPPKPAAKPVVKKVVPAKKEPAQAVVKEQAKKQAIPVAEKKDSVVKPTTNKQIDKKTDALDTSKIVVSYRDAQTAYRFQELEQELSRRWRPPHGVPDGCACSIAVQVDAYGKVKDVHMKSSSNILMFDVQVRATILAVEWPRWAWGATFPITLKA
jgi:outer membrane biosynthesis protein TonB